MKTIQDFAARQLLGALLTCFVLSLLCGPLPLSAQRRASYYQPDPTLLFGSPVALTPVEVLDTTRYAVYYRQSYWKNPERSDPLSDLICLDAGCRYSRFYSLAFFGSDLGQSVRKRQGSSMLSVLQPGVVRQQSETTREETTSAVDSILLRLRRDLKKERSELPQPAERQAPTEWEILCDYESGLLHYTDRIPGLRTGMVTYDERIPPIEWQIDEEHTSTILGYRCHSARTTFRGRRWRAWFTDEIPDNRLCVWKLSGLPGLILRLEDDQRIYTLEAVAIRPKQEQIWKYAYDAPHKTMTRAKWHRMLLNFHENAYETIIGKNCDLYRKNAMGQLEIVDEWSVPYNPVELE